MILVDMVDGAAETTMKEGVVSSIEVDFKLSVARLLVSNELDLHYRILWWWFGIWGRRILSLVGCFVLFGLF